MSEPNQSLDPEVVSQLQELLDERFAELVERFIADGQRRLVLLHDAIADLNYTVIHAEGHGLKGSSRNIGANQLGDLCAQLEEKGRVKADQGVGPLFAAVEQEFAAVSAALVDLHS